MLRTSNHNGTRCESAARDRNATARYTRRRSVTATALSTSTATDRLNCPTGPSLPPSPRCPSLPPSRRCQPRQPSSWAGGPAPGPVACGRSGDSAGLSPPARQCGHRANEKSARRATRPRSGHNSRHTSPGSHKSGSARWCGGRGGRATEVAGAAGRQGQPRRQGRRGPAGLAWRAGCWGRVSGSGGAETVLA